MYKQILNQSEHRSSPLPDGPWVMSQKWENLLFMHFRVAPKTLKSYLPEGLEVDLHQGEGWVTVLPFRVSDMHFRKLPRPPYLHSYLELNVRTYVKRDGIPGLYFFSLDANKLLAVLGARMTTLPYYYAQMEMKRERDTFSCYSKRWGKSEALLKGTYRPVSSEYFPNPDSLDYWLLERYYAWSSVKGFIIQVGIHHTPWKVQRAEADIQTYQLIPFYFDDMSKQAPLFHYAEAKHVLFWPLKIKKASFFAR